MKRWKIIIPAFLAVVSLPLAAAFLTSAGSAAGQEAGAQHDHDHGEETGERTLQVTVWDDLFEAFIEYPPPVAGVAGRFLTHLTELDGFKPRRSGAVVFVISSGEVTRRYSVEGPERDGIYSPAIIFPEPGTWELSLMTDEGDDEHLMKIGSLKVHASSHDILHAALPEDPVGIGFLKERQWKMDFDTDLVRRDGSGPGKKLLIDETTLVSQGEKEFVFVQLGGETFAKRELELGKRE
ncbi:MAG TPA: hypothetical protein VLA34_07670, partial [Candidatus Krumholzibacterium sp.]|nr:hypothetical protein [Candidatus Krumholzibacterium sp.]